MSLSTGAQIGPYTIGEEIGSGGMGVVYRATDQNLKRDVAIKALPESFSADADWVARFEREAQTLAALNHPNIAQIYGLERADGTTALAMELIEGPTLADRIAEGSLPPDEALGIAMQVADALEAAHGQGIVHRDLKPANIKLRSDGTVKVLDFGIAKTLDIRAASGRQPAAMTTPAMTQTGIILGTAAYMSPEQARGRPIDQRTDIWAFGCLLYEMLTGQPAFAGEDVAITLARILANDTNMKSLPGVVSPAVRHTIELCLEKDERKRIADIRDVRFALEGVFESGPPQVANNVAVPSLSRRAFPIAIAILITTVLVGFGSYWIGSAADRSSASSPLTVRRSLYHLGATQVLANTGLNAHLALSPDGTRLAYAAQVDGTTQLYVRELDQLEARPLPDTNGAQHPFFSPDGEWIAFYTDDTDQELKRVAFRGGPAQTLATAAGSGGGFWSQDDRIIFSMPANGIRSLLEIPATGGTPELLLKPEPGLGHQWPAPLPRSDAILFVIRPGAGPGQGSVRDGRIAVLSLETGEFNVLIEGAHRPHYVPTGHILFVRSGALWAVPFDAGRLAITGPEVPVIDGVQQNGDIGGAAFAVSDDGLFVYIPGFESASGFLAGRELVWVDRDGREESLGVEQRPYFTPQLSPDGQRLAVGTAANVGEEDIWIVDLARRTLSRLTFGSGEDSYPRWTPDSQRVVYWSDPEDEEPGLFWQAANGTGQAERLTTSAAVQVPQAFTSDGTQLIYEEWNNSNDLFVLSLDGSDPRPLLNASYDELDAVISPDGRWIAYCSYETGRPEIYIRPFPNVDDGRWQISEGGGLEPLWSTEGRELYFRFGNQVLAVGIDGSGESLLAGTPEVLFSGAYRGNLGSAPNYDLAQDGRFVMLKIIGVDPQNSEQTLAIAVENWFEELRTLAPSAD